MQDRSLSAYHSQHPNQCFIVLLHWLMCYADARQAAVASTTAGGEFTEPGQQAGGRGLHFTAGSALELVLAQAAYAPGYTCQVRIICQNLHDYKVPFCLENVCVNFFISKNKARVLQLWWICLWKYVCSFNNWFLLVRCILGVILFNFVWVGGWGEGGAV